MSDEESQGLYHQIDLMTWQVQASKVLKVNEKNVVDTSLNDDYHIVCIESDKLSASSGCLNYPKFKNVVGLVIKVENIKDKLIERLIKNLNHNLRSYSEFFIQIFIKSQKKSKIYLKAKNLGKLVEFSTSNDQEKFEIWSVNSNCTFKVENLCEILQSLDLPFDELTFNEIFNFCKFKVDNETILQFLRCIEDDFLIRIFRGFDIKLPNYVFRHAILTKNFKDLYHAFKCIYFKEFNEELVEILLNNEYCEVILMSMAQKNDLNLLKGLLIHPGLIQKFVKFYLWSKVRKFSLEIHSFNVHIELQRIESFFYQQFDEINLNDTLKSIEMLHENISIKNLNEIMKFVLKYPDFKLCVDMNQVCALERSIHCKSFEIYAFMRSEDFIPYNNELLKEELKGLDSKEVEEINKFNLMYVKGNDDEFIHVLYSKCDLFSCHGEFSSSEIWEMHKVLAKLDGVRWIMKNASKSEIQIVFDLRTEGVNIIDHTQEEVCHGVAFNETKKLYVGRNINKLERFGTFAHELTHYVMFLVYENDSHPYCEHDVDRKEKWDSIIDNCIIFHETSTDTAKINKIIAKALAYQPDKVGIELAVKVPELLAYFYDNPDKIEEIRQNYSKVFDYFFDLVIRDLKIPFVLEMNKLNQDLKLLSQIKDSEFQINPDNETCILSLASESSRRILLTSNVPQLVMSSIFNELKNQPGNKLNLKVRNIYLDLQKLDQKNIKKEFEELLPKAEVDRVIVKVTSSDNEKFKFVNDLKPKTSCFGVSFDSSSTQHLVNSFKFIQHSLNFAWSDLIQKSKDFLLQKTVNFQSRNMEISRLLERHDESISTEILSVLCSNDELQVNVYSKPKELDNFIPRSIQIKKQSFRSNTFSSNQNCDEFENAHVLSRQLSIQNRFFHAQRVNFTVENYELDDFLNKTVDSAYFMNVVIISDMAGSGKTTLLKKITEILISKYPSYWISLISLKDHIKMLSKGITETFVDFTATILKLDAFSKEIFTQKYSQGKAKILFDGFDEISPSCKENSLKLIKSFELFEQNQIFITTRTHLEHELEEELNASSHNLKILEDHEQVEFLTQIWSKSHPDSNYIEKCANSLVIKIAEVIFTSSSAIGLPLIIIGLAEVFKDKINENFYTEIEKLNITEIYKKVVTKSLDVLHVKFPEKTEENLKRKISLLQNHVYFSVLLVFDEDFADDLGLSHDEDEWPLEEIARGGILKYNKEGKSELNHLTYADYFIAGYLYDFIKNLKKPSPSQIVLLAQIFTEEKFQITRIFLDNMLEEIKNPKSLKILNSSEKVCKRLSLEVKRKVFELITNEGLFNLYDFFHELIGDVHLLENYLEDKIENEVEYENESDDSDEIFFKAKDKSQNKADNGATNLMKILPKVKSLRTFNNIIEKTFEYYSENVYKDFLMKTDNHGNLIFHHLTIHCCDVKLIETFWRKVESNNLRPKQIEQILTHKNDENETFFLTAFRFIEEDPSDENSYDSHKELTKLKERNAFIYKIFINNLSEKKLMEMFDNIDDLNFYSIFYYDFSIKLAIKVFFKEDDFLNDLKLKAIIFFYLSSESFPLFWRKIESVIGEKELLTQIPYVFNMSVLNPAIFPFIFEKAFFYYKNQDELEKLIFKEHDILGSVLTMSIGSGIMSNIKILFDKIVEIFGVDRVKFLLKENDFKITSKLITLSFINPKQTNLEILDFLKKNLEKIFNEEEIFQIFLTKNHYEKILCDSIECHKSLQTFKLIWLKIRTFFPDGKKLKEFLLIKNDAGMNVLQISIVKKKESIFIYLLLEVYSEIFELKEFIYEVDNKEENFFHKLIRHGSVSMLESATSLLSTQLTHEELFNLVKLKNSQFLTLVARSGRSIESFIHEFLKKWLTEKDYREMLSELEMLNFITLLQKCDCEIKFLKIWEKIEAQLTAEEFQHFLLFRFKKNMNLFHSFVLFNFSSNSFDLIFSTIKEIYQNQDGLKEILLMKNNDSDANILLFSIICKNEISFFYLFENVYCEIFDLKEFIYEVDDEGENFFHNIARYGSVPMLESATAQLITQLSCEELIAFLKMKNTFNDNILHMTASNTADSSIKFLIDFLENLWTQEEFKAFLSSKGRFSHLPLHVVFLNNSPQVAKLFVEFYQKLFTKDEIVQLCSIEEEEFNRNIFEIASQKSEEMFDVVASLIG